MTKKEKLLCLPLLALLLSSCRVKHAPPAFTLCTYLESGSKYCVDNRVPDMQNGKEVPIVPGDIVMPPESFKSFFDWGTDLRKQLIQCENQPRN